MRGTRAGTVQGLIEQWPNVLAGELLKRFIPAIYVAVRGVGRTECSLPLLCHATAGPCDVTEPTLQGQGYFGGRADNGVYIAAFAGERSAREERAGGDDDEDRFE